MRIFHTKSVYVVTLYILSTAKSFENHSKNVGGFDIYVWKPAYAADR